MCLDTHMCMCMCTYISRNLFFGEWADPRTGIGRCMYVGIRVRSYTEADCGRERRRRIYLRRGKVGSTESATKVSRSVLDSGYIWSFGADLWMA